MLHRLERRSVPDELRGVLRMQIMQGMLRAGEHLREEELSSRFNASRGTVREALRSLEYEGLVQRDAHRGSRVTLLTRDDVVDIMAARRVVEPEAVRRAGEQRLALDALRATTVEMREAARGRDWSRYGELDVHFHAGLVRSAGSERLAMFFRAQTVVLRLAWMRIDESESAASAPLPHVDEHAVLLDLIGAGAVEQAVALIHRHLDDAAARLLSVPTS